MEKYTINKPLKLVYDDQYDFYIKSNFPEREQQFVSKEIAEELLDALKEAKGLLKMVGTYSSEKMNIIDSAITNATK
ncbi:MAG: hypothetical protein AABY22_31690 [Nanoarchaeota archaeon]